MNEKGGRKWGLIKEPRMSPMSAQNLFCTSSSQNLDYVEKAALPAIAGDGRFILWKSRTRDPPDSGTPVKLKSRGISKSMHNK